MQNPIPNFIDRLQNLPDDKKQKVMIGATIIIMVIVIWLWVLYFNTIVVSARQ